MRILLWNLCYGMGWDGSYRDVLRLQRCMHCPKSVTRDVTKQMDAFITSLKPDICCFLEVFRGAPLLSRLHRRYPHGDCAVKYAPTGILRRLPFFRSRCNAVLSRKRLPVRRHALHHGRKRLLLEVGIAPGVSLWVPHLALGARQRRAQLLEIAKLMTTKKRHIVAGDCNIFGGVVELKPLQRAGLILLPTAPTYPASSPRLSLDVALFSQGLTLKTVATPKVPLCSDHRPLCFEVAGL